MSTPSLPHRLSHAINAEAHELRPALSGFLLFFCLFAGYFMLRPIRESMGISAGVENLQWLFTATFFVMLAAVPLFAWLSSRVPRLHFIDWVYGFFCLNLLLFAALFQAQGESPWLARVFYVWISVYNLFVVSVAWSLMADVFDGAQAKRLFAFIAAGASVGGLLGPALSALLVGRLGESGLMLLAGLLLGVALALKYTLMRWREVGGAGRPGAAPAESTRRPLPGNPFSGMTRVLKSPYLLGIAGFVVLLATVTTFLYFEQARLVAELFPDRQAQIRVFGSIDLIVQAGALLSQLFITGRLAEKLGVRTLLAIVPLLMCVGFVGLALAPGFAMLAALMIVRRIGEYAFVRPGREMLFAPLDAESKYKAKNVIDTVVYRAGDAISGWAKSALDMLGQGAGLVAVIGAVCALLWGCLGWRLGQQADRQARSSHRPGPAISEG
ncbi:NTP/NDP exchange transporter [Phytopseudomonas dryadis]|uniref:MFS transporter n=1 Tax=Phytopseudomonas dryadis TaxID=2487520 RepID=A0A4Q9QUX2_9GAMM|nr:MULTISPECIES: MFS transporter [Pseudomonas]TBU87161.1 MFS transporter [Pseudomonas dryadis]TBV01815.1 MFS transporter [Pseudomonas dryadis]TBV14435.1 MFS transporter [Pseudomonas sp. FRB 230]